MTRGVIASWCQRVCCYVVWYIVYNVRWCVFVVRYLRLEWQPFSTNVQLLFIWNVSNRSMHFIFLSKTLHLNCHFSFTHVRFFNMYSRLIRMRSFYTKCSKRRTHQFIFRTEIIQDARFCVHGISFCRIKRGVCAGKTETGQCRRPE